MLESREAQTSSPGITWAGISVHPSPALGWGTGEGNVLGALLGKPGGQPLLAPVPSEWGLLDERFTHTYWWGPGASCLRILFDPSSLLQWSLGSSGMQHVGELNVWQTRELVALL